MTVYGYARVSTGAQDHAGQVADLQAAGVDQVVTEAASAAAGKRRPALAKLLGTLSDGDVLVVTRLDRLARSTLDLLTILRTVGERGAGFRSLREPWADTTTPAGRMIVVVFAGVAEFERELILTRTAEGRKRAKAEGRNLGRRPTLTPLQVDMIGKAGPGEVGRLAAVFGVSRSTIARARRQAKRKSLQAAPLTPLERAINERVGDE